MQSINAHNKLFNQIIIKCDPIVITFKNDKIDNLDDK